AAVHRRIDDPRIILHQAGDLAVIGEAVRITALVAIAWQADGPVRELEGKRVPALAVPAVRDAMPLQHDVLAAVLAEAIAHRHAGLAAADHHDVVLFPHARPPDAWDPGASPGEQAPGYHNPVGRAPDHVFPPSAEPGILAGWAMVEIRCW